MLLSQKYLHLFKGGIQLLLVETRHFDREASISHFSFSCSRNLTFRLQCSYDP